MEAQTIVPAPARAGGPPSRLSLMGDERLARLVAGAGSERAFASLYERYHQPLYRYCRSMLRNDADAQDALQSTLAGAFAALKRGQRDAPLRPWLYRIAHNESVSLLRRRRPEYELSEASECSTVSVEERAEARARLALLVADLRELPERQRGALVMRELSGLSHEEIALALGTSVGAAKQTIFEARRSLSEFVEGRAMVCEEVRRAISDGDGRALRGRRVRAHLRDCSGCAAFAAAIPARGADLRAIAPPLPAVVAAGLLTRVLGGGSGHGAGGASGLAAGAAGKTVGAALSAKVLAGAAILATTAVGVTGVLKHPWHATRQPSTTRTTQMGHAGAAAQGVNLASPALARQAGARPTANHAAPARGVASAVAGTRRRTRSAGQAAAAFGFGGVAHGGSDARGLTRGVPGTLPGSAGSPAAQHGRNPSASVPLAGHSPASAGRPITPGSRAPGTTAGGHAPGRPVTPARPSPSVPRIPTSGSGRAR
ncbi:MAG: sigma-70 family RNA polymerase sigma factor [Solirubrobacteraceae bacterium]